MQDFKMSEMEGKIAEDMLTKFAITSENKLEEQVSLTLILRAIPSKIQMFQMKRIELFNFSLFQASLIAYQNTDMVNAFEYFDELNKSRVSDINFRLGDQIRHELTGV